MKEAFPDNGYMALTGKQGDPGIGESNLPAGLHRKIANPHPKRSTARARRGALVGSKVLIATGSACELDDEALTHEVGTIWSCQAVKVNIKGG